MANKDTLNREKTVVHTKTNNFGAMIDTSLRLVCKYFAGTQVAGPELRQ